MAASDAIVVGGGLAGLTAAIACADRGLKVALVTETRPGEASAASAGVLGPSIGRGPKSGRVGRFMFAARDMYPRFLETLFERSSVRVPLVTGALEVAFNETHLAELRGRAAKIDETKFLDAHTVADLEPTLAPVAGALHHPNDGAVDVATLLTALQATVSAHRSITRLDARALALVDLNTSDPAVNLSDGSKVSGPCIVLAAGAWVANLDGVPRELPVRPVKGEIAVARGAVAIRHVVFGAGGYLVPRGSSLLVGATSEEAGFDAQPSESAALELRDTARALLRDRSRAEAPFSSRHVGLRPMTPDGYPILGRDKDVPAVIYACGYSRNGVLLSPLAADCLAALIANEDPGYDLTAFSVSRFGG